MTLPLHHYAAGDHCPCYCGGKLAGSESAMRRLFSVSEGQPKFQKVNALACDKCGYEPPEGGKR